MALSLGLAGCASPGEEDLTLNRENYRYTPISDADLRILEYQNSKNHPENKKRD